MSQTLNLNSRYTSKTSVVASFITILNSRTDHFDPGRLAATVLRGSENESPYPNLFSWAEYPQRTINNLCGNLKPRGQVPDNNKLHLLESLNQINDRGSCRIDILAFFRIQAFQFEQCSRRRYFRTTNIFGARIPSERSCRFSVQPRPEISTTSTI